MYSEFTFHFTGAYQRAVQFYWWCMSRAGKRFVLLTVYQVPCYMRKTVVTSRPSRGSMAAHGVAGTDAAHHADLLDDRFLRPQMDG